MNSGRFRGVFWSDPGKQVPGTLDVSPSGELDLEVLGSLDARPPFEKGAEELAQITGELAESPFPGPMVTLLGCLRTRYHFGTGGVVQRWLAHRALVGRETVHEGAGFHRVTLTLRGLSAFLGRAPSLIDFATRSMTIPTELQPVGRLDAEGWTADLGWRTIGRWSAEHVHVDSTPVVEVSLTEPLTVDGVLSQVVPTFELLLTLAMREYAGIEGLTLHAAHEGESYQVLWPQISKSEATRRNPHAFELLFRWGELPGGSAAVRRLQSLFREQRNFTATFLSNERSPGRYVEDRLRAAVVGHAHFAAADPSRLDSARQALARISNVPSEVRAFMPSAELIAVRAHLADLLTPAVLGALGALEKEAFLDEVGSAFRWATLREGDSVPARALLGLGHQLRALLFLALLRFIGFEAADAEMRWLQSLQWRALP